MHLDTKFDGVVLAAMVGMFTAASAPTARAQDPLRWKFEVGEKLDYDVVQDMTINIQGTPVGQVSMATHQQMDMTWEVVGVNEEGEAVIRQKVERVRVKMTGLGGQGYEYDSNAEEPPVGNAAMAAPMFEAMTTGEFELTLTARGKLKDVKVPEAVLTAFKNSPQAAQMGELVTPEAIQRMMMQDVVVFPKAAPAEGESWSTKTEISIPAAGKQTVETTYTYQGTKEVEGKSCAVIGIQRKMEFVKADDQQLQVNIKEQTSDGQALFNIAEGRLDSLTLEHKVAMEATSMGRSIEQKMEQKAKVNVTEAMEESENERVSEATTEVQSEEAEAPSN